MRRRLNYANVMATIAVFVALGGTATAAKTLITGRQVRNGSLTGADVRDRSLTKRDLKRGTIPTAIKGAKGDKGDTGAKGDKGDTGAAGTSIFDGTIPAGKTVKGLWLVDIPAAVAANETARTVVDLPIPVASALVDTGVAFGTGAGSGDAPVSTSGEIQGAVFTTDEDAACTGTFNEPTAPSGKLCFYVGDMTNVLAESLRSFAGLGLNPTALRGENKLGVVVRLQSGGAGLVYARGTWAYTG